MRMKIVSIKILYFFILVAFLCFYIEIRGFASQVIGKQKGLEISVMSNVDWTDTGLDVFEGQEIFFRAGGQISLQRGNPVTYCGPDGYNYQSLQQPIQDQNIGALIGKVYFLISVEVDEETGEEIRNEKEEIFYIGSSNRITIPMDGRLYLGINENLVVDNEGVFHVLIYTNERQ